MSTPFQNRLVGSIIVAAAVVIFLPDILDGEKKTYQADFEAIPQAPAFKSKLNRASEFPEQKLAQIPRESISQEQAIDDSNAHIESAQPATERELASVTLDNSTENSTQPTSVNTKPIATQAKKALPEKSVMGEAWVIHLGSFKHKKNVNELLKKLKDNGYTAFTRPIKTQNGVLTKVIVGPELNKSALEAKVPALKKLTKVDGKLAKYTPNK